VQDYGVIRLVAQASGGIGITLLLAKVPEFHHRTSPTNRESSGSMAEILRPNQADLSTSQCAVSEEYASRWVHQDCHVANEQKAALKKAAGVSGGKDECQVRLKGRERDYWMGTEIGMLGEYGFQGQVTAGDDPDKKGKWEQDKIT